VRPGPRLDRGSLTIEVVLLYPRDPICRETPARRKIKTSTLELAADEDPNEPA
jgi:hypothetical protein